MTRACPVPSPARRRYGEIRGRIEQAMLRRIHAALREAADQARAEIQAAGLDMPPPSMDHLASVIHQNMYCTLCKADPRTFSGGRADIAIAVIRNSQNIARHHWGAKVEPYPRD